MKVLEADGRVWKKKRNPEVEELGRLVQTWPLGVTKLVQLEKPLRSLRSSLIKEVGTDKQIKAKMANNDPKQWFIMVLKTRQKRGNSSINKMVLERS